MSLVVSLNEIVDLLFYGIDKADWSAITEAYFVLTGKELPVPSIPDDGDDTAAMLQKMMDRLNKLENNNKPTRNKKKATPKVENQEDDFSAGPSRQSSRTVVKQNRENKFESMKDAVAEAERERGFDKINDDVKPVERNRKSYTPKQVKCGECGTSNQVHPLFVRDNYVCDRCIQRRGG